MAPKRSLRRAPGARAAISKWRRRIRWARRLIVLGALVGSGRRMFGGREDGSGGPAGPKGSGGSGPGGGWRNGESAAARPAPIAVTETQVTEVRMATAVSVSGSDLTPANAWVQADDNTAPDGYPVKVNTRSGIYHVPGGRAYDRTRADRWYRSPADAEADGYRPSKST